MNLHLSEEQERALALCKDVESHITYVTGKAGTGKSTVVREKIKHAKDSGEKLVVTAPTGIAALNVEGETIHRFIRSNPSVTLFNIGYIDNPVIQAMDTLLIDEASMVRADMLDMIYKGLCQTRRNDKPFGAVKVIMVGDLCQLPPVVVSDDKEFIHQRY